MPLTEICNATYTDPRQRQLFKNIIYVGALSRAAGASTPPVIEKLIAEQYKGKEKLLDAQHQGAAPGPRLRARRTWPARSACACGAPTRSAKHLRRRQQRRGAGLRVRRRDGLRVVPDHAVVVAGRGVRQVLPEVPRRPRDAAKNRYAIVQAEDEIASIGMVVGAGWNGARAFTAHLGSRRLADDRVHRPGVLRRDPGRRSSTCSAAGPSTGMPTRTQQADVLALRLRLARRHQARAAASPRIRRSASSSRPRRSTSPTGCRRRSSCMTDLDIGMNQRLCAPLQWDDGRALRPRQGA